MIHCISGQPDVISRHLAGNIIIFHGYDDPLPPIPVGAVLILHEPSRLWLANPPWLPTPVHRILLTENPTASDIKAAVNGIGITRITNLAELSQAIKDTLKASAISTAETRMEGAAL